MARSTLILCLGLAACSLASAQTTLLSTSSSDYEVTTVFSDVDFFSIVIEFDAPLTPGAYVDPEFVSLRYEVSGFLEPGTPSGFSAFDLQRSMTGTEFYAQGSSLSFEIDAAAVFSDGIQVVELVGNGLVLTFNGREIDNGRYHPALLELNADGTGRIQNSNNVVTSNPLLEVGFGEEYITDLVFDPGNTTVISENPIVTGGGGGGGTTSPLGIATLLAFGVLIGTRRRRLGT